MTDDSTKWPLTLEEASSPTAKKPSEEVRRWQEEQIRRGIAEADAGDFVTLAELKESVRKFVPHG